MSAERILPKPIAHQTEEPIKSLSHIHTLDGDVDLGCWTQPKHYAVSATRISRAIAVSPNPQPLAMRRPLPSISTNPVPGSGGVSIFTRTNCCSGLFFLRR